MSFLIKQRLNIFLVVMLGFALLFSTSTVVFAEDGDNKCIYDLNEADFGVIKDFHDDISDDMAEEIIEKREEEPFHSVDQLRDLETFEDKENIINDLIDAREVCVIADDGGEGPTDEEYEDTDGNENEDGDGNENEDENGNNNDNGNDDEREMCVDINTAEKEELFDIIHIDEYRADLIIDYRENQKFESVQELTEIDGIAEERIKDIIEQDKACVLDDEGDKVPETSTNAFNCILIGVILMGISLIGYALLNRRAHNS